MSVQEESLREQTDGLAVVMGIPRLDRLAASPSSVATVAVLGGTFAWSAGQARGPPKSAVSGDSAPGLEVNAVNKVRILEENDSTLLYGATNGAIDEVAYTLPVPTETHVSTGTRRCQTTVADHPCV